MSNIGKRLANTPVLYLVVLGTLPLFLYGFAYSEIGMRVFDWEEQKESLSPVSQTVIVSKKKVLSPEEMKKNENELKRQSEQAQQSKQTTNELMKSSNIVRMTASANFRREATPTNSTSPPSAQETEIGTEEIEKTLDEGGTKKTRVQRQTKSKGVKKSVSPQPQKTESIRGNTNPYDDFVINTTGAHKPVTENAAPKNELMKEVKAKFVEDKIINVDKTYTLLLQIKEAVSIGGIEIPKNTMVTASSRTSGNRMLFDVYEIEVKKHVYPIKGQ